MELYAGPPARIEPAFEVARDLDIPAFCRREIAIPAEGWRLLPDKATLGPALADLAALIEEVIEQP